ncbi:MAG TPA: hypothetical protein VLE23_07860, partial [Geminicoccaceae bacterium]|nr:hypothetical protein [Geminicoccaceae bacterium]
MSLANHKLTLAMLALLAGTVPAVAQSTDAPATGDRWLVRIAPYLWATSMDGNATVAGIESDVDVPFSDILKDLSFAGMLL